MARDDLMLRVIPDDFGVELIWRDGPDALFGTLRDGGCDVIDTADGPWETHTCGVWHFVAPTPAAAAGSMRQFGIRQWHVPRYAMAEALEGLRAGPGKTAPADLSRLIGDGFAIGIDERGGVHLLRSDRTVPPIPVPPSMLDAIDADIGRLRTARSRVAAKEGTSAATGLRTAAGHEILHGSRRLVEAIVFEHETLPDLTAGNFGVYSAYCTHRDFDLTKAMPDSLMQALVAGQWRYDADDVPDDVVELFLETQRRLLPRPIWGPGIDVPQPEAARILGEGMRSLPMEKRVQFVLMNGMHGAGLFLPLAVLTGCVTFEQYAQYVTQDYAPDAGEEQDRRKHVAFIALYGELAAVPSRDHGPLQHRAE